MAPLPRTGMVLFDLVTNCTSRDNALEGRFELLSLYSGSDLKNYFFMKYFKHETSDRNKLPSKLIRSKFGAEGYGIYNALLEVIGEEIDKNNSDDWGYVNKMHTIETLADECSTTPEKLKDFLKFCDGKEIFSKKNKRLYSYLILERVDEYTAKLRRDSVVTKEKKRKKTEQLRPNRIEENRREQNRIEENRNNGKAKKIATPLNQKIPKTILGVDTNTILNPKGKSGISKEWQDKAFRHANYLHITLKDEILKVRWLAFFRDKYCAKVDSTVSYLTDYAPFLALKDDKSKMKYFFQVFYNKS